MRRQPMYQPSHKSPAAHLVSLKVLHSGIIIAFSLMNVKQYNGFPDQFSGCIYTHAF